MDPSRLYLILDTSAILCPNEIETFWQITRKKQFGTLPTSTRVLIPYVVIGELRGLMNKKDVKKNATAAYNYLSQFIDLCQPGFHVHAQWKLDADDTERTFYPPEEGPYDSLNDSLILAYCVEVRFTTNMETWLISEDRELLARCTRSGLVGMTMASLRLAMDLVPYRPCHRIGNDYHCWKRTGQDTVEISLGDGVKVTFRASDMFDLKRAYRRISVERRWIPPRYESTHFAQLESARSRRKSAEPDQTEQGSEMQVSVNVLIVIVIVVFWIAFVFGQSNGTSENTTRRGYG